MINHINPSNFSLFLSMKKTSQNPRKIVHNNEINELIEATMKAIKMMAKRKKRIYNQNTLQTTEVVHETYLKLVKNQASKWNDKTHFLITFSHAMKNLLIDRYRKKMAIKRGDGLLALDIDSTSVQIAMPDQLSLDWIGLEIKLEELKTIDADTHDIVLLRYFAGLEIKETAEVLKISARSVSRKWAFARTWLHTNLT